MGLSEQVNAVYEKAGKGEYSPHSLYFLSVLTTAELRKAAAGCHADGEAKSLSADGIRRLIHRIIRERYGNLQRVHQ